MLLLALVTLAHAVPPNATPALLPVGNGTVDRLAVTPDGAVVVGRDKATDKGFVLYVEDWSVHSLGLCTTTGVAAVPLDDGTYDIYVACSDGSVRLRNFDGAGLQTVVDDEGAEIRFDLADALSGVWFHDGPTPGVYALTIANDQPQLFAIDPASFAVDDAFLAGYPVSISPWKKFDEGVIVGDQLIIHHAADNMTAVGLGANPSVIPSNAGFGLDVVDITPSPSGGVYTVSSSGVLAEYLPQTMQFYTMMTGLSDPNAVVVSLDPKDPWLVVTGQQIKVWELTESGAVIGDSDDYYWASAADLDNPIQDAVVSDGYMFGGGEGGNVHVSTARPWVRPLRTFAEPSAATEGDTVTLTFAVADAGDYEIRLNGDRTGSGALLASGTIAEADVNVDQQVEIPVSGDDWAEGDNHLYVILTEKGTGLTGHARATVFVDNPPDPPELTNQNLSFSDGSLLLEFEGIDDEDLDRYEVYVTTTPFVAADWPTGGPPYDGTTGLKTPILVTQGPGEPVSYRIQPLENDVKHYIAVRAWDVGGLEGPMSRVISEVPRPTYTAAELAGEEGGAPCSTAPAAAGWLAVLVGAAGALRRRRAAAALLAVGIGALAPGLAVAQEPPPLPAAADDDDEGWGDLTPVYGNFELRYGVIDIEDDTIASIYDQNPSNMLMAEFGPQLWRVLELDVGIGFFQELAFKVDADGVRSGDRTMLTWYPLMVDGTFRLQILDEQVLVPHARFGLDYIIWNEKADNAAGGKDVLHGAKTGIHYGLGAGLLLDVFAPRRASLLEAQTGVNDTYVVFEWRRQRVDDREFPWDAPVDNGFDFSGDMFTAGLKLDF